MGPGGRGPGGGVNYLLNFKFDDIFDSLAIRLWSKDTKHLILILVGPGLQG